MAFPFNAVAVWDFDAANEGEMNLKVGDSVVVTAEADGGWFICTNTTGLTGYIPQTYVEKREDEEQGENLESNGADSEGDSKSPLKKKASKKKLDGGAKLKSSSEKALKKKDKMKDGAGEEKKDKKGKKASTSTDTDSSKPVAVPALDVPAASSNSSSNTNESTSPRSARPLPSTPASSSTIQTPSAVGGDRTSPRSGLSGPPPMPASISPRSNNGATSGNPKIPSSPSTPPVSASQTAGSIAGAKNASASAPSSAASSPAEKRPPPAVPHKRPGMSDTLRGANKAAALAAGAEPPTIPKKGAEPVTATSAATKSSVPMPPPRGRPGVGGIPSSVSSPRLNTTSLNGSGVIESTSSQSLNSSSSSVENPRTGTMSPSGSQIAIQPPVRSASPSRPVSHGRTSSASLPMTISPPPMTTSDMKVVASTTRPTIPALRYDDERDQRRYFIVTELLTTERTYVAGLEEGVTKYYRPLLAAAQAKSPQHVDDIKAVFSVIEHLVPLNQNLMLSLEERILAWTTGQRIGDTFVKVAPFLKMYTTYSNNYDTAIQVLSRISHEPFFATEPAMSNRAIESILITPIQRIPRYSLLLSDLLKNTKEDHVDYSDIAKSLAVIKDVADHVNKGVGIYKNVARLTEASLAHLLAPHRSLIRDGNITVVKTNAEKKSKKHSWHIILFSDVLVFINIALDENLLPKKDKKGIRLKSLMDTKEKVRKEIIFPLYLVWLDDPGLRTGFDLIGPNQRMNLYFSSSEERDEWWALLENQVKQILDKTEQLQDGQASCPAATQLQRRGKHSFTDNDVYDGQWDRGRIHGKGRMACLGASYDGVFDSGYEAGSGTISYPSGMKFTGDWKGGKPTGSGTMEYPTGEVYTGEFKDGKRSGKGVLKYKDGSVLDTEWRSDLAHGIGTLSLVAARVTYAGGFVDGKFSGAGVMTNEKSGIKYDGQFKDNWRHGRGKMIFADKSTYDGEWKDDRQHGTGKWSSADGSSYEGEWKNDAKEGKGHMRWPCGDEYTGSWAQGRPHGNGAFSYKSSSVIIRYDGDVQNGKRHGRGIANYASGAKYEGDWSDDAQHGNGKMTQSNGVTIDGKWNAGVADQRCVVSVKGVPLVPAITTAAAAAAGTQQTESLFPIHTEVPLIPTFDTSFILGFTQSGTNAS